LSTTVSAGSAAEALRSQMMFTLVWMVGEKLVDAYSSVTPCSSSVSIAVTTGVLEVPVADEKSPASVSHWQVVEGGQPGLDATRYAPTSELEEHEPTLPLLVIMSGTFSQMPRWYM
jgi:hypothetical protein